MEAFRNYFRDIEIKTVLDVGTGGGGFIYELVQAFPGAEITGIDPHPESLEAARENYPAFSFLKMEAEKILFEDNRFDVVSISMALHHLSKIKKGLKEMKRVAKPGGWIIINELVSDHLNEAQQVHRMYHHFKSRIDRMMGICHRETFTRDAILQMLKTASIPVQFFFEYNPEVHFTRDKEEIESRVKKMEQALEQIKDREEYEQMKPQIGEFRERAMKFGFEPATHLVIVGRSR